MFLSILCLLLFRQQKSISKTSPVLFLEDFGFQKNGIFTINISSSKHKQIYIAVANSYETSTIMAITMGTETYDCSTISRLFQVNYSKTLTLNDGFGSYSEIIGYKSYYTPIFISCDNSGSYYQFSLSFLNPNSHLDYRIIPCIYTKPVSSSLFGLLLVVWLINWLCNFTLKNSLHTYLTITFVFTLLSSIISFFEIYHNHRSDDYSTLTPVSMVFRAIQEVCLLSAMMMAAKGWCIIIDTVNWVGIFLSIVYSLIFIVPMLLIDYMYYSLYVQIGLLFVGFCGAMLYYHELVKSIREALHVVVAHLLVISQSGINPETTPIYAKCRMFRTISMAVLFYFVLLMFKTIFGKTLIIPYWIIILIYDIVTLALMTTAAWIFRLKKTTRNGYMMVADGENVPTELNLEDIANLNANSDEVRQGTAVWQEGMVLPPQPIIIRASRHETSITNHHGSEHDNVNRDLSVPLNQPDEKGIL
ncbi:hypothetical protein TRFO_40194 [Tritrichomonas foetus]|uniref:Intimal thickness related receptor IRP domain-containing protein n=1 Tax=Tritrichomonas foetus TaxID=1144522 RepID=A0A1J4J7D3_9EUKA|nr:hypothetical protein TRFO_40194 [Tritrichomonas foetus]|eukprot:OHS93563.1 hypothetical protein TRFO_40194 [Tritrichomonas foetus]